MILVGRYLSPFVRRVATTLHLYDLPFEHRALATMGDDREHIREMNPVTRVPALVLDDGEVLVDSGAIIDYLDERVGPDRALTPCSGRERRRVLKLVAVAVGSAEKSVLTVYEKRFRPQDKWHAPWVDMIAGQARDGFRWLDAQLKGPFLAGEKMTQADVTAAIAYEFVQMANPELFETFDCPELGRLASRLSQLEAFKRTRPES